VIAGTVGGGGRLEYTVVGDAVNVAQRLQSEAGAGEIVAAAATVAAAPGVPCELIGPRQVKGREEPDTLLFFGAINYFPNHDGVVFFIDHILRA
jgi:class 3 adenylate cyclase